MKIVVGVDTDYHSMAALERAVALTERLGGELHVFHATHVPATVLSAIGSIPLDVTEYEEAETEATWEKVDEVLAQHDVNVIRATRRGYPPDAILDYAEEVDPDLIVLGSRGRSELAAFLLGSTGHRVLHYAHCDVMIVKHPEEQ